MDFFLTPLLPLFVHVVIECPQWVLHVACLCLVRSWQESRTKLSFGACTMAQCYPFGLQIDLKILGQKRSNLSLISDQPQINLRSISVSRFFCQIIIGSQMHFEISEVNWVKRFYKSVFIFMILCFHEIFVSLLQCACHNSMKMNKKTRSIPHV